MDNKAPVKSTKSQFDIQMDNALKAAKHSKGISFALYHGNHVEYVNIPNHPLQNFKYFENTSHLTNAERQAIYSKRNEIKLLTSKSITPIKLVATTDVEELVEEELLP